MAASTTKPKRSPLTPSTITPPYINRQHSYNSRAEGLKLSPTDATSILAKVATRPNSPKRSSPLGTNSLPSPGEQPCGGGDRRRSWEDCEHQRDGYISFPDFDTEAAAKH